MSKNIQDQLKEYGFIFASGLAGIIFAQNLITGESGNAFNYLVLPTAIVIGSFIGKEIRRSLGKSTSDERDIQNFETGMTWGFITFVLLTAVEASTRLVLATTEILMWSVAVAFASSFYLEIRQSGLKGLIRL